VDRGLRSYTQALDALFARTGATSKFGLDRTIALLDKLGRPHDRFRTVHVAGTNGKGSVVSMLYALLRDKGLSVGRYTSPHLVDFRERIVVDDQPISEAEIVAFLDQWEGVAVSTGATFFEITTAMAFHHFASREVDVAVIETGLGGRLDATNVIRPIVSGITSIAIDHTEFLGTTEAEIAREKAGIIKPGIPSVIGRMSKPAREAIHRAAVAAGAAVPQDAEDAYAISDVDVLPQSTRFSVTFAGETIPMSTGLVGAAQAGNASLVLAMLRAAGADMAVTLERASQLLPVVRLPGRFERRGNYILDVAHNPDGIRVLTETLEAVKPDRPVSAILGVLADKDWRQMMALLAPHIDHLVIVSPPTAPRSRAWTPEEAVAHARTLGIDASVNADFSAAITNGTRIPGTVIITGSFHTVGDALQVLQGSEIT
jgi:dihydrofolate synthase/folylpolyglutamate synthase